MMITTKLLSNSLVTFVRYFKNLSIGSATGIEPTTSHIAAQRSTAWANTAAVKMLEGKSIFSFVMYAK